MFEIDELAYRSAALRWSPAGKFLFVLALLVASLMASTLLVPLVVLIMGVLLLGYSIHFRFPRIIGLIILEGLGIIIIGGLVIALATPGATVWTWDLFLFELAFTDAGLSTATLITLRALAGMSIMLFFATSTPIPHFADMLMRLRVPKEFAELMVLVYRYSFMLLDEAGRMHLAAQCRLGFRGRMNTLRTYAKMMTGMFIRSIETAERSNVGMQCRNYQSSVGMLKQPKGITLSWTALSVASFILLYQLNVICAGSGILVG